MIALVMVLAHVWFAIAMTRQHLTADFDIGTSHIALGIYYTIVVWWRWSLPIGAFAAILWLAGQQPPRRGLERALAAVLVVTALATGFVAYLGA